MKIIILNRRLIFIITLFCFNFYLRLYKHKNNKIINDSSMVIKKKETDNY